MNGIIARVHFNFYQFRRGLGWDEASGDWASQTGAEVLACYGARRRSARLHESKSNGWKPNWQEYWKDYEPRKARMTRER